VPPIDGAARRRARGVRSLSGEGLSVGRRAERPPDPFCERSRARRITDGLEELAIEEPAGDRMDRTRKATVDTLDLDAARAECGLRRIVKVFEETEVAAFQHQRLEACLGRVF